MCVNLFVEVIVVIFGSRLKTLREEANLTREEFSRALSLSYWAVSKYEQNQRFPDYETLNKIADYFSTSIDYLLGRTDNRKGAASYPSDNELHEFLKNSNVKFDGTPLDDEDKKDVLDFLRMILRRKKK
jgi:transcriptional regulator with XRE-family HTH domain